MLHYPLTVMLVFVAGPDGEQLEEAVAAAFVQRDL